MTLVITLLHGSAGWRRELGGVGRRPLPDAWIPVVPFKAKAACRRHIPKQQHRVTNWAAYDAGLRARGSPTVGFTTEAIAAWRAEPRTGRGGGISVDGTSWISCRPRFLVPVRVLSRLFRRLFLAGLADAHAADRLAFFGEIEGLRRRRAFNTHL